MAVGNRNGFDTPAFGVQPSGPKTSIARLEQLTVGRATPARGKAPHWNLPALPSPQTLDYAHKFTSTTILLVGAVAFLLIGPRTLRGKLHALGRKHVGGS